MSQRFYTWEVKDLPAPSGSALIEFRTEGLGAITIAVPAPAEGVDVNEYVAGFAPIGLWEDLARPRQSFAAGLTGAGSGRGASYAPPPPIEPVVTIEPPTVMTITATKL